MTENSEIKSKKTTSKFIRNVLVKGLLLFLILNFAIALIPADSSLGKISLYNVLLIGRERLPFGENSKEAYNLSLYDLDAMFASHEINAGEKPADEFRIILIGDSATWGTLLKPDETLSGLINQENLTSCDGQTVRAYNLAYPSMSLTKDLLILDKALTYNPDLIIWPITLESFPNKIQFESPIVANNPEKAQPILSSSTLDLSLYQEDGFTSRNFWDLTLIGRRRAIFDVLRLQFYGVMWSATGIDQTYPENYTPAQRDFEADDDAFQGWAPSVLPLDRLATRAINVGYEMAGDVPLLVINEPILVSKGENSNVRYNAFYPRWAYDQYRLMLAERAQYGEWQYYDFWNAIPESEFTNSPVHLTPEGSLLFYQRLEKALMAQICQ